jgi:hypothetical protein
MGIPKKLSFDKTNSDVCTVPFNPLVLGSTVTYSMYLPWHGSMMIYRTKIHPTNIHQKMIHKMKIHRKLDSSKVFFFFFFFFLLPQPFRTLPFYIRDGEPDRCGVLYLCHQLGALVNILPVLVAVAPLILNAYLDSLCVSKQVG